MRFVHQTPAVAIGAVLALAGASESQTMSITTGGSRVMFVSQTSRAPYRSRAIEISPRGMRSVALEGRSLGETSFRAEVAAASPHATTESPLRRGVSPLKGRFL